MAAEIAHHAIAVGFGMLLDCRADISQLYAGPRHIHADHQALIGHIDQLARFQRHIADQEHAASVAMPAIDDDRHVDIDDVAILQRLVVRNAMAHHLIDRGAAAVREPAIAERGRHAAKRDHVCAHDIVQLARGDAGHDMRDQRIEHLGGGTASAAHAGKAFLPVKFDGAVTRSGGFLRSDGNILVHMRRYRAGQQSLRDGFARLRLGA